MEAPYLLSDTHRRGWGVACSCGWRSPLLDEREDALAQATEHLEVDAHLDTEAKGFLARRRAKRSKRKAWEERRRS